MYTRMRLLCLLQVLFIANCCLAQTATIRLPVASSEGGALIRATVELRNSVDSSVLKTAVTDSTGEAIFTRLTRGSYFLVCTAVGFVPVSTDPVIIDNEDKLLPQLLLQPTSTTLEQVTVAVRKPFIQLMPDKTIVNVESGISNAGASVLEVMEKSPGITVDKDGNISLKGRQNVLILIDGKQTYLPAGEIASMLGGMSASQIDQIEIMDNPPAKYDAAGNAGVINIRTKKIKQKGFNGNLSSSYGQGRYFKNNNSLALNLRQNMVNMFLTYSSAFSEQFTNIYALRSYYEPNTTKTKSVLNQNSWLGSALQNHTIRAGADFYVSKLTTIGFAINAVMINRRGRGDALGTWLNPAGQTDSLIRTLSKGYTRFRNGGGNLNFKHIFGKDRELTADFDILDYSINGQQRFDNIVQFPSPYTQSIDGTLPSKIRIYSAKTDYHHRLSNGIIADLGYKSSFVRTDNLAEYFLGENGNWKPDYDKTNHFLYNEQIHALYASAEKQLGSFNLQGGLRYERTSYDAHQQGNLVRKDSMFDRAYDGIFPSLFLQYKADSNHNFSITAGRRIDRPAYQKLNPFVFVINKYTYQQGNPFFLPQYTWNFQLTHQFRQWLMTSFNYNITNNYFSQIFLSYPDGTLIYSEGNLGRMRNIGITVSTQVDLAKWWALSFQGNLYNKKIEGVVWDARMTELTQFNMNINNQFRFRNGWSAELSGFFVTKEQELQEITDPTGQIIAGVGKQVLRNKGSLKLSLRDIFYTQAMKGDTNFEQAFEYFKLTRDSRVLTLGFTYRFGKSFKTAPKRTGASEEIERVGNGA